MAAQQTTYSLELPAPSQPGFVSDTDPQRVRPFRNDNASAVAFGVGVCRSANADLRGFDTIVTTRQFLGVTTWGQSQEQGIGGAANDGIATTEMNGILEDGEVFVSVMEAVTPDVPVRIVILGANLGKFGTTKVTSVNTTTILPNAKYITSTAGAGVAKVRLGLSPVLLVADT